MRINHNFSYVYHTLQIINYDLSNMAEVVNDSSQILTKLEKLDIKDTNGVNIESETNSKKWGLPLTDVYKLALSFYKEKEGKAVQLSYEDKLQLVAFAQQVNHGPLSGVINKLPPLGALDVVGHDRRLAWERLGNLSTAQAREGFVELLSRRCSLLAAHIEAHRREKEEKERLAKEEEKRKLIEIEERQQHEAEQQKLQEQLEKEEALKRQIQQALNEQTYEQFRAYAEQQFPGEPERQGALVRQLQEQHYFQYMQQLQASPKQETIHETNAKEEDSQAEEQMPCAASMWTRSDIEEFKQSVAQADGDGVVRVGHGETVTVRVPTHREGSRLFWEFSTDHYDIGFGVYFEWGVPSTDQVSVHVSESDEDDEDIDEEALEEGMEDLIDRSHGDIEVGSAASRALLSEIVPVFRRDCQTEVYAGSHSYPGQGVYLLKFDNSYSLWRSKTLYYRVYYTH